jgi:hypothetical protein
MRNDAGPDAARAEAQPGDKIAKSGSRDKKEDNAQERGIAASRLI